MNAINSEKVSITLKHRYGLLTTATLALLALLALIIYQFPNNDQTSTTPQKQIELKQYAILAPTNAILKNYLANEGELITKSSAVAILIAPHYEERIQQARNNASEARLILEEKRTELIVNARKSSPSQNRSTMQNRIQAKRNQREILHQKETIHKLTVALTTFQAKLVNLNSQPFGIKGNSEAINATKADITKFQGKLDIANAELQQLQNKTETKQAQANPTTHNENNTTSIYRSIKIAQRNLEYKEDLLKKIQKQESQFSTIIPAPFSGLIIETIFPESTYVREGQPILIMMQQDYK